MKQSLLCWLILSWAWSFNSLASAPRDVCWSCAEKAYENGEYRRASVLYEEIYFFSTTDSIRTRALFGKLECLSSMYKTEEVQQCLNRLHFTPMKREDEITLYLKEAIYHLRIDDFSYSEFSLSRIQAEEVDSSIYFAYHMIRFSLALKQGKQEESVEIYQKCLQQYFPEETFYEELQKKKMFRSAQTAKVLSSILPGAGQIYGGRPDKAFFSLALFGGSVLYTAASFVTGYPVSAVLTGIPLSLRFYFGGRDDAFSIVNQRNNVSRIHLIQKIGEKMEGYSH